MLIQTLENSSSKGLKTLEAEAESLYAEAADHYQKKRLFDLKPLLEKLGEEYARTTPVTDADRTPSYAEMKEAVADLGKRFTVRLDGEGDFKSIQAAIDQAPPNSLIEIQDNGPYYEKILVPKDKPGLTLRGSTNCWPLIRSGGPLGRVVFLAVIEAPRTTLERLAIIHTDSGGHPPTSLNVGESCRLRSVLWGGECYQNIGADCELENCCMVSGSPLRLFTPIIVRNCVSLNGTHGFGIVGTGQARLENIVVVRIETEAPSELRFCTVFDSANFGASDIVALDSIFDSVLASKEGVRIENSNVVSGKFVELARPGKNCFSAGPQYVDPKNSDYRLMPTSPCIGRASDGGNLGVRYTPEMIAIMQKALELRAQGIIKF